MKRPYLSMICIVTLLLQSSCEDIFGDRNKQTPSYNNYKGLVMAGYQGWFTAEGDSVNRGWHHYELNGKFEPGISSIDFWPDVSEYEITYVTAFKCNDSTKSQVYSSTDEQSVDLHFKWMQEYGIDGVFIQRFITEIIDEKGIIHFNKVLENALKAAKKYNRAICIMYDLSGCTPEQIDIVNSDWKALQEKFDLLNLARNPTYLHHEDKPLLAIWGIGFNDDRNYTIKDTKKLIDNLNKDNELSLLIGVPYYWRELKEDAVNTVELHELIQETDIILPWSVGRYNNTSYQIASKVIQEDIDLCNKWKIDYVPTVFPGFSWGNLQQDTSQYKIIKREKGQFLWNQIATAKKSGATMLYVAMFDEIDEGTAIFKCLKENDLPINNEFKFVGIENELDSDNYLWLCGQAANWIHGEKGYNENKPIR